MLSITYPTRDRQDGAKMLLDFTVGNFGPFRDDATLSMNATKITDHTENLLNSDLSDENILSSAIIFGPNAAGKTFFVNALSALIGVIQTVDGAIPSALYAPYRLSASCRESPVRMRIRLILGGILYDYRIEYESGTVISESLRYYPRKRPVRVFTRSAGNEFVGAKKHIEAMAAPGKTYLAMAALSGDPTCTGVRNAILNEFVILPPDLNILVQRSCAFSDGDPQKKAMTVKALNTADLGISDFTFTERKISLLDLKRKIPPELYESAQRSADTLSTRDIFLKHEFPSSEADEIGKMFPIELESAGTTCMFGLIAPLIDVLENGKILVMDELGAHLHPVLTRWIVEQFSERNNPNGAQLIANTHDISLMDIAGLLRRDQIWFVNKDRTDGSSELYCLSDFGGVRKDTDVLRRYLDGRFDAVPAVKHRGAIE